MVHATSARAALENLAAGLSLEWSRFGIRTICIAPGTIATEGLEENYSAEDRAQWAAAVPLGRLGTPDDVSGADRLPRLPRGPLHHRHHDPRRRRRRRLGHRIPRPPCWRTNK